MFKQIAVPASRITTTPRAAASQPSREIAPNLPVELDDSGLPVGFSRELDADLPRRLYSTWKPVSGDRAIIRALRADEQLKLEGRAKALEVVLLPFGDDEVDAVESEIGAMFSGFRSMRQQGDDVEAIVAVTRRVVREFPSWAIAKACLLIAQNKAEIEGRRLDRRYAPNDDEIYLVVEGVVKLRKDALKSAKALLAAPVEMPSPPRAVDGPEIPFPQKPSQLPPVDQVRSGYASRVMADLELRRARRESTDPPKPESSAA